MILLGIGAVKNINSNPRTKVDISGSKADSKEKLSMQNSDEEE